MKYKLLAADMDATALNSKKELTPANVSTMEKAIAQGKTVVFSTGRSISLVKPYIDMVRGMRYAVTGSGASVIDTQTGKKFLYETIDPETVKYIAARAAGYVMPIFFIDDKTYSSAWCVDNCADFGLSAYDPVYRKGMNMVDDAFAMFMAGRGYDQIRDSICYPNLNVKCVGTHGGLSVGEDGATHQCVEDIALMRVIPGMVIINPADDIEARAAVFAAAEYEGPVYM